MKLLNSIAMLSLLLPTLLFAENAEVGSRPMSEEAAAEIQNRKPTGTIEEEEEAPQETLGYGLDRYPPVFYSASHHRLVLITIVDNGQYTLELEDGSVWKISNYDAYKALNWQVNDALTITQNNRWFTKYNYRIINKSNGVGIEANLFLGPVVNGEYSRFIVSIDQNRREIVLSDNTHWDVSYLDSTIFRDWSIYDYLIIGTNSNTSFWDTENEAILINVNMNNCVRAKQF